MVLHALISDHKQPVPLYYVSSNFFQTQRSSLSLLDMESDAVCKNFSVWNRKHSCDKIEALQSTRDYAILLSLFLVENF